MGNVIHVRGSEGWPVVCNAYKLIDWLAGGPEAGAELKVNNSYENDFISHIYRAVIDY